MFDMLTAENSRRSKPLKLLRSLAFPPSMRLVSQQRPTSVLAFPRWQSGWRERRHNHRSPGVHSRRIEQIIIQTEGSGCRATLHPLPLVKSWGNPLEYAYSCCRNSPTTTLSSCQQTRRTATCKMSLSLDLGVFVSSSHFISDKCAHAWL